MSVDISGREEELEFRRLQRDVDSLIQGDQEEVSSLEQRLFSEKAHFHEMWRMNCQCLAEYDKLVASKAEIQELKRQLSTHRAISDPPLESRIAKVKASPAVNPPARERTATVTGPTEPTLQPAESRGRRGKAPPVDSSWERI